MDFRERARQIVPHAYAIACPYAIDRGEGSLLFTSEGKRLIDFTTGIAVMNVGHAHPKVVAAIQQAASKGTHYCFAIMGYESYLQLGERLIQQMPAETPQGKPLHWKAAFFNSGAEAVENAIKISRYATGRQTILAFEHAFHGRTYGAMSLTSKPIPYRRKLGPFLPEVLHLPYPTVYRCACLGAQNGCDCAQVTLDRIKQMFTTRIPADEVAAMVIEPIVGEGGFYVPPPSFLPGLRELCDQHGILLVFDEVQTGIARTGNFFRFQATGVTPDIVLTAKALGGGMPISGVIGKADVMDSVHPAGLGSTFGGNPVSVAAAHAVLDVVEEEDLCRQASEKGAHAKRVMQGWQEHLPVIGDVRGEGLMLAVEFVKDRTTKEPHKEIVPQILNTCYENGLAILAAGTFGNCVRLLPALNIPDSLLDEGLAILESAIRKHA